MALGFDSSTTIFISLASFFVCGFLCGLLSVAHINEQYGKRFFVLFFCFNFYELFKKLSQFPFLDSCDTSILGVRLELSKRPDSLPCLPGKWAGKGCRQV